MNPMLIALLPKRLVHHQRAAMQCAPEHHLPVCPVPKPAEQHGQHQVDLGAGFPFPVAAKRDIEIVPQPCGKADVPALPEFRRVLGEIRHIKVFAEVVTKCLRRADGHIRIAGKITVDLNRIGDHGEKERKPAIAAGGSKHRVHADGEAIRNHNLLDQAK
ncbi:hypothetical protein SDC9_151240 [bioreactor metagenome]|uniref:Uncharacterized protein n=1 Tax=bioreactor metagenome TaxID=1076179 RepID=A0A645EU32_9ZZZZ